MIILITFLTIIHSLTSFKFNQIQKINKFRFLYVKSRILHSFLSLVYRSRQNIDNAVQSSDFVEGELIKSLLLIIYEQL